MKLLASEILFSDILELLKNFTKIDGKAWEYLKHKKACEVLFRKLQSDGARVECLFRVDGVHSFALHIASEVMDNINAKEGK